VIHTHPIYSSVFGALHESIPAIAEDFAELIGNQVVCSAYQLPGTKALAQSVISALGEGNAVLMPNHGAVCVGATLANAYKVAAVLEKTAHIYLLARAIGTPHVLSESDVATMMEFMRHRYGQGTLK